MDEELVKKIVDVFGSFGELIIHSNLTEEEVNSLDKNKIIPKKLIYYKGEDDFKEMSLPPAKPLDKGGDL